MAPFLQSDRIILRPLEEDDFTLIAAWSNNNEVTHFMFTGQKPLTEEQIKQTLISQLAGNNTIFMAVDKETKKPFGYAGLYEINPTARKAEFRILIGDKDFWGRGHGTEITEMLTYYGFDRLNLHRIFLGYTEANEGARRAYEKAGYVQEGVLKDDIYRNSTYYNTVRMALLRDEYYTKYHESYKNKFQ
ncbi:GNAT family N-acetyltransferase [Patescibacteria group bacterium]|nr:GNAT family N-acetyltransferase [Patescibacteria group bacterium]